MKLSSGLRAARRPLAVVAADGGCSDARQGSLACGEVMEPEENEYTLGHRTAHAASALLESS